MTANPALSTRETDALTDVSVPDALRNVGCVLTFDVTESALLAFQVAPAVTAGQIVEERIEITHDGVTSPIPVGELAGDLGGRIHCVAAPTGTVSLTYFASLRPQPATPSTSDAEHLLASPDAIVALRQSRYCPSDAFTGFAATEFMAHTDDAPDDLALHLASWVFERLAYTPGASGPLDSATDTLLSGSGVCHDFAQLTITLCPRWECRRGWLRCTRPGFRPWTSTRWSRSSPRPDGGSSIHPPRAAERAGADAAGPHAADTAFATTLRGSVELVASWVLASSDGDLPADDHAEVLPLA